MPLALAFAAAHLGDFSHGPAALVNNPDGVDHGVHPIRHLDLDAGLSLSGMAPVIVLRYARKQNLRRVPRRHGPALVGEKQPAQRSGVGLAAVVMAHALVPSQIAVGKQQLLPRHRQLANPENAAEHDHEQRYRYHRLHQHRASSGAAIHLAFFF